MKSLVVAGFVVILALASSANGWAQGIGGGAKIGVNFSTVSGDIEAEKSLRTGLLVGGFLTVPKGNTLAFQPEVLFSMQGVKGEEADGTKLTYEINEIQIPLLLRVGRSGGGTHLLLGPSIGIVTSAKATSGSLEQDIKDDLKSTDIGFIVGAGVTVNRFLIEARYNLGLTNLNDDSSGGDNKSRVFSVLVGVGL
ncbi:MAG: porin family protein [Vicinamibacterales bacterium]